MKHNILIVDDEPANLRTLERLLGEEYNVLTATSGAAGLDKLVRYDVALIISDQRMPGMTGLEFLKKAAEMRAQTVRIILTGYTDVEVLVEAINSGVVYRYLTKPWSNNDLRQTVMRAIEHYETSVARWRLEQESARNRERMKATIRGFVNLALEMLRLKGARVQAHAVRSARYARLIGEALGMTPSELNHLNIAALLHEVANIRIPERLLSSATPLRDAEMAAMQEHFKHGVKLIADVPELAEIASIVNFQHDHYDGHGSASRLSGDQIPLESRILAIADAYDEMREPTSSIFSGFTHAEALSVLQSAAGRKYDPELVSTFCGLDLEAARV